MITNEIIQRVQSQYSKGVESDDSRLTPRHIYNTLLSVRSMLLSQKAKKRQKISQWNYQTIPCIKMIKAQKHECPCIPPIGCDIYKSKEKLPKPLLNLDSHLIDSVTSIEGSIIYNEIGWTEAKYKSESRYTSMKPDYFIRNEYLYIIQKKGATVISMTALFQDPIEVSNFPSICDNDDCEDCNDCDSPLDMEFPIDGDLIKTLVEITSQELLSTFTQMREDVFNDANDRTNVKN